jgi:hypothetical protein
MKTTTIALWTLCGMAGLLALLELLSGKRSGRRQAVLHLDRPDQDRLNYL